MGFPLRCESLGDVKGLMRNITVVCVIIVFFSYSSCSSYQRPSHAEESVSKDFPSLGRSDYANVAFRKYQFQSSQILDTQALAQLGLESQENLQYVLFAQFVQDFWQDSIGKERGYLIGKRQVIIEEQFQTQEEYYDLLFVIEKNKLLNQTEPSFRQFSFQNLNDLEKRHNMKTFFLTVQDFNGDGLDDFFLGFELYQHKGQYHYYLYNFQGQELTSLLRPWDTAQEGELGSSGAGIPVPFMRELNADIYPAFVAEIELDFRRSINIDLSPIADDLIRDKVYDKQGLVLRKRGIPHLDSNPILFPVRHNFSNRYMLRSVQQIRNRYGQIGILVCNWRLEDTRWIPDENSIEFLAKPRV